MVFRFFQLSLLSFGLCFCCEFFCARSSVANWTLIWNEKNSHFDLHSFKSSLSTMTWTLDIWLHLSLHIFINIIFCIMHYFEMNVWWTCKCLWLLQLFTCLLFMFQLNNTHITIAKTIRTLNCLVFLTLIRWQILKIWNQFMWKRISKMSWMKVQLH